MTQVEYWDRYLARPSVVYFLALVTNLNYRWHRDPRFLYWGSHQEILGPLALAHFSTPVIEAPLRSRPDQRFWYLRDPALMAALKRLGWPCGLGRQEGIPGYVVASQRLLEAFVAGLLDARGVIDQDRCELRVQCRRRTEAAPLEEVCWHHGIPVLMVGGEARHRWDLVWAGYSLIMQASRLPCRLENRAAYRVLARQAREYERKHPLLGDGSEIVRVPRGIRAVREIVLGSSDDGPRP